MSGLLKNNFYSHFVEKILNTCWLALNSLARDMAHSSDVSAAVP